MKKVSVVLLTAGFLFLAICDIALAQRVPDRKTPNPGSQPQPAFRPIASGRQRITRDRRTVAILRGSQDVVVDYFTELMIARIVDDKVDPQNLNGVTVSLTRDAKVKGRWNVFQGGGSDGEALVLTENVFRIRQVLSSTEKDPVKIQVDGRVYRLEPGEVLFLLG